MYYRYVFIDFAQTKKKKIVAVSDVVLDFK